MAKGLIRSSLLYKDLKRALPIIERGEGIYLYDSEGKRYIDGSGGSSAATAVGHGVKEIVEAMAEQGKKLAFNPYHYFASQPVMELAELVAEMAPGSLNRVWFCSGGSEATENAVKLVRQYQIERGKPQKFMIISRWLSFHGATLGSLGYGGNTYRRKIYAANYINSTHIPAAYCYRCYFSQTYPGCGLECAEALEKAIRLESPDNVAAFIAEPVVGATLGAVPPVDEYFPRIRQICDQYDVLFIADEVMTGIGRTGENFGMDNWKVVPDLIATAKGLGGGYTPLGGIIVKDEILAAFEANNAPFVSGHTYAGNPLSCATGLAVLRYILDHDLIGNARRVGAYMLERMQGLRKHDIVGDVRGKGLMAGIELVKDKKTKEPFPAQVGAARAVGEEALNRGLITYPGIGCVDGYLGDHIKLSPPLIIKEDQVDEVVGILDQALAAAEQRM